MAWVVLKAGQVGAEEGGLSIKAKHQLSWGLNQNKANTSCIYFTRFIQVDNFKARAREIITQSSGFIFFYFMSLIYMQQF